MKALSRLALACAIFFALAANAWAVPGAGLRELSAAVAPATAASSEPTRSVIVGFDSRGEAQAMESALHLGGKTLRRARGGGLATVQVPSGTDVDEFVRELSAQPGVQYAEPDGLVYEALAPDDTFFPWQWSLPMIGAPAAWDVTQGASVKVAVVDSGVDLTHPDLVGRIDTDNDWDFVHNTAVAQDDDGHGTHVAGIIGATLNNNSGIAGVASQCTILPIKVMTSAGIGASSNVADGIRLAADKGATVINLSLGSPTPSVAIDAAVQYAIGKDCVVVAASGNEGSNAVYYPAASANVIGVAATDLSDARSSFSNYGPRVDISAPGSQIRSMWVGGDYRDVSGTSMAAPHVTGVVALIRARNPSWTRAMVERQLLGTVVDLGAVGRDDYYGYGRVRADRAVGATVTAGTLTGRVYSRGAALAGVMVSVPDHAAVRTAQDGSYTVPEVTPATYRVTFSKTGYASHTTGVSIPAGATASQDASLRVSTVLSTPRVVGRPSHWRRTSLKGSISPARSKRMTVQVRKLIRHRWRSYRTVKVTANSAGAWQTKLWLKSGRYSIRVLSAGDATYSPGVSLRRKIVVR